MSLYIGLASVVFVLFCLLIWSLLFRRSTGSNLVYRDTGLPEGYTQVRAEALEQLRNELADLQRQLGEKDAAHRAEIAQVQQKCVTDMAEHRSRLALEFAERRRAEAKATAARSRVSLVAKISEHIAPLLAGFPWNFKEARWFGEIFDFLVFDGLEDGRINEVIFVEVKSGNSRRISNPRERALKDAIDNGRVSYQIFHPDVEKAKKDDDREEATT